MNVLELFCGAGGGILAGSLLGWRTVCAVEKDEYARSVLIARQNDGCLEPFPIWDDVQTFDGRPWNGLVDVVSGGFPCQDISQAGKGVGIEGEKSGLWKEMARVICEVEPRHVFVENVPTLTSRGLDVVLGDLAEMGFDAKWGVLGANAAPISAPHQRARIWIVATDPNRSTVESEQWRAIHDKDGNNKTEARRRTDQQRMSIRSRWWESEPDVGRVANGVASRVDRLRCLGNGQVPAVAALAWRVLNDD